MTTPQLQFFDGRDVAVSRPLFSMIPEPGPVGAGAWVQLGGSDLSPEALGRQRGIVEASGGTLVGVVPEALLWPRQLPQFEHAVHVDICRSFTRLTVLTGGERITIAEEIHLRDCGLEILERQVLAGVAAASVKQTRYDPLHNAAAEMELRGGLVTALPQLAGASETALSLGGESVGISAAQLAGWCQPIWGRMHQAIDRLKVDPAFVKLAPSCGLPNLSESFAAVFGDKRMHVLESESRESEPLRLWLEEELPLTSCWLLQTRPRPRQ